MKICYNKNIKIILTILLILPIISYGHGHNVPKDPDNKARVHGSLKGFYHINEKWLGFLRYDYLSRFADRVTQDFRLGLKHGILSNLKIGAFYRARYGNRNEDDWIKADAWHWRDSSDRREDLLGIHTSPRFLLDFLPGKNWVIYTDVNLMQNFNTGNQIVEFEPKIIFHFLDEGQPTISPYAESMVVFEFGDINQNLVEKQLYIGSIFHINRTFQVAPFFGIWEGSWNNADSFHQRTGNSFEYNEFAYIFGTRFLIKKF